jgi:hypothetical protein
MSEAAVFRGHSVPAPQDMSSSDLLNRTPSPSIPVAHPLAERLVELEFLDIVDRVVPLIDHGKFSARAPVYIGTGAGFPPLSQIASRPLLPTFENGRF